MRTDKVIKDYKQYNTNKTVCFHIKEAGTECTVDSLKLHTYLHTSNMTMFNRENKITRYESTEKIIDDFCKVRFEYYTKRKNHLISELEKTIRLLGNKERFIREVIDETLEIRNVKEVDIVRKLEGEKYDKVDESYSYLLSMEMRSMTYERMGKIKNDYESKKKSLDHIKNQTEKEMWIKELDELEDVYKKWLIIIEKEIVKKNIPKDKKGKK